MIFGIEKAFTEVQSSKEDQENNILRWSADAVKKDTNVQTAMKTAKESQARVKQAGSFPVVVPAELVAGLQKINVFLIMICINSFEVAKLRELRTH